MAQSASFPVLQALGPDLSATPLWPYSIKAGINVVIECPVIVKKRQSGLETSGITAAAAEKTADLDTIIPLTSVSAHPGSAWFHTGARPKGPAHISALNRIHSQTLPLWTKVVRGAKRNYCMDMEQPPSKPLKPLRDPVQ